MSKILSINEENLNMCVDSHMKSFEAEPWNETWTKDKSYKRLHDIYLSPDFIGFLYLENNIVLGALFGNCEQAYDGVYYFIKEMFVSKNSQGKGIGTLLIKSLEEELKKLNINNILLYTSKEKNIDKFYRRNEFKYIDSLILMEKDI